MRSLLIIMCVFVTTPATAQFLQFLILVSPEVETTIAQELTFGQITRSSEVEIPMGSINSGWFKITVINAAEVNLMVQLPETLHLEGDDNCTASDCILKSTLRFAYTTSTEDRIPEAARLIQVPGNNARVIINAYESTSVNNPLSTYTFIFINVYGVLSVGDVLSGNYIGEALLDVTY